MIMLKASAAIIASAVMFVVATPPASAASPITDAFLANIEANVSFLDRSSRVASDYAVSDVIRGFARSEVSEQNAVAEALGDARQQATAARDDIVTGRSVAIDGPGMIGASAATRQAANGRSPLTQAALDQLKNASGKAFDDLYWTAQLDALSQIEADYRAYIAHGDDPSLVALAKRELPKVVHRLELLSKV